MVCVVVGSGVTGLTAAVLLAQRGHKVTLVEARPHPAPLLRGFQRAGLHFDTGFHCGGGLHQGGVLRLWLQALGVDSVLRKGLTPYVDNFYFANGTRHTLPSGRADVLRAVGEQFPGCEAGMERFLDAVEHALAHSPYLNPHIRTEPGFAATGGMAVSAVFEQAGFPPPLRTILGTRCLLYGLRPQEADWHEYALVAGPYFQSNATWEGGGRALARAFLEILSQAGVTVRCGAAVTGIEADREGVRSVRLAHGEYIPCDYCFFTGHPSQLAQLTPPGLLRPVFLRRISGLPETQNALLLFAEATAGVREGENIYLLPRPGSPDLFPDMSTEAPCVYLFCHKAQADGRIPVMAAALLPEGLLPTGDPHPRPALYTEWKKCAVQRLQSYVEGRLPGLAGHWRVLDAASGLSLRHWIHGGTGSLYGVRHHRGLMPLLPPTRLQGLFLAGQNVLLPGVLGGIVSAALAVGFALGHDVALKEFRQCAVSV